jgi:two-component system response regulator AtoC
MKAMAQHRILVVDDEENMRFMLSEALSLAGHAVETAKSGAEALGLVAAGPFAAAVVDLRMPGMDGMETLAVLKERAPDLPVIMMSAYGDMDAAVKAVRLGADDYLPKPFDPDDLIMRLARIIRTRSLEEENRRLRTAAAPPHEVGLIGKSAPLRALMVTIDKVASYQTTVLITGESGTGKEVVARLIHRKSPRRDAPFVAVNCAAIPETLLESELFGYRKGAFTGAAKDKPGLFQEAGGGTLFLDEIGELPAPLQVKLLRALQERSVRRVGSTTSEEIDVRLLAATARDLKAAMAQGLFREDLFYRLNVVPIAVPPLRDRREDIPLLADYFVGRCAALLDKPVRGVSPEALRILAAAPWSGNVRQLENVVERAVVMAEGGVITPGDLPPDLGGGATSSGIVVPPGYQSLRPAVKAVERIMILRALASTGGNLSAAARMLEIDRKSLREKMREQGFEAGENIPGRGE